LTTSAGRSNHPVASATRNIALAAWADNPDDPSGGDASLRIYFSMAADGGRTWIAPEQVSPGNAPSVHAVASSSDWIHVLYWRDSALYLRRRALPPEPDLDGGSPPDGASRDAAIPGSSVASGGGGASMGACGCRVASRDPPPAPAAFAILIVIAVSIRLVKRTRYR
jgi:hypothetical protein